MCCGWFYVFFFWCMVLCFFWIFMLFKRCVWKNCIEVMCKILEFLWYEWRWCFWDFWLWICYICFLIWLLWVDLLWFDFIGWNWENFDVNKYNFIYFVLFWWLVRWLEKMKLIEGVSLIVLLFGKKDKM